MMCIRNTSVCQWAPPSSFWPRLYLQPLSFPTPLSCSYFQTSLKNDLASPRFYFFSGLDEAGAADPSSCTGSTPAPWALSVMRSRGCPAYRCACQILKSISHLVCTTSTIFERLIGTGCLYSYETSPALHKSFLFFHDALLSLLRI
jgi:hypothetical protein